MAKGMSLLLGASLLAATAGAVDPDCPKLFSHQWAGGRAEAKQAGTEYEWVFNPCAAKANVSPKCDTPPYSGTAWLAQINLREEPAGFNPCSHMLFCDEEPKEITVANGVVHYQFEQCIPSQDNRGPSPRSATVVVHCDSPTFRVDPVTATRTTHPGGLDGFHFTVPVHGPCGPCPAELAGVPLDYFTMPANPDSGDVYDWAVNLCNQTQPEPFVLGFVDTVTRKERVLDVRDSVTAISKGWEFKVSSSKNDDTATIRVEKAANGGPCRWLGAPVGGVNATVNGHLATEVEMTLPCRN